jgi:hypothetical protein
MQIESLSIEDLAALRDKVISTLADKVAARQKELLAESERVGALVTSKPFTTLKRAVKVLRWGFGMVGLWDNARLGEAEGRYAGELRDIKEPGLSPGAVSHTGPVIPTSSVREAKCRCKARGAPIVARPLKLRFARPTISAGLRPATPTTARAASTEPVLIALLVNRVPLSDSRQQV